MTEQKSKINELYCLIKQYEGHITKTKLANKIASYFNLEKKRSVYACADFAVRFSYSKTTSFSNTVLALSTLKKYDDSPFFVCLITPKCNYLYLANSTFLSKISHSSQALSLTNIKGSFNGSDIMKEYNAIENKYENFEVLYAIHQSFSFSQNLERLVQSTNEINPTGEKVEFTTDDEVVLLDSVQRTIDFIKSKEYNTLLEDLNQRVYSVKEAIFEVVDKVENVNKKGQFIEFLIASNDEKVKNELIVAMRNLTDFPNLYTKDELGDFNRTYNGYKVAVDIKSKDLNLMSNPKGYNLDKALSFFSKEKTVFFMYFVGVDVKKRDLKTKLVPIFDEKLLKHTHIQKHWAGRNSRGVSQFYGSQLNDLLNPDYEININCDVAKQWLQQIIAL